MSGTDRLNYEKDVKPKIEKINRKHKESNIDKTIICRRIDNCYYINEKSYNYSGEKRLYGGTLREIDAFITGIGYVIL